MNTQIKTTGDRLIDALFYTILTLIGLATLFPMYYVVIMSITPLKETIRNGGFVLFPSEVTFSAYRAIFESPRLPQSLKITTLITVLGTFLNLVFTLLLAYPLSRKQMPGRKLCLFLIVFTMVFNGGLIPNYLVVKEFGLLDSIWALIIPSLIATFNLLIAKTFFENMSIEIQEAAKIDGCNDLQTLFWVVLPLSKAIIATIGLFYAVAHWNEFFAGIMFITNDKLYPLQVILRDMLQQPNMSVEMMSQVQGLEAELPPFSIRMAMVVATTLPILFVYPFVQKYFTKGVMLGAIKG
ncbi:Inner membrane ABC transporter permease protein ycjP [Chlamydia abortus]|uniref:Carbohydrate ABC transporter permease n=1 Tax=Paenibacillus residui TaxID=629724 RepID=A0ABW3DII3_9BACL|nr:carbohydrate ABC transporter permease [Paenibacillus sp. 32O-W]SHE14974.1 Inner membrane ABC transporter permease protein ycjP [Chlamydia abortus]